MSAYEHFEKYEYSTITLRLLVDLNVLTEESKSEESPSPA